MIGILSGGFLSAVLAANSVMCWWTSIKILTGFKLPSCWRLSQVARD